MVQNGTALLTNMAGQRRWKTTLTQSNAYFQCEALPRNGRFPPAERFCIMPCIRPVRTACCWSGRVATGVFRQLHYRLAPVFYRSMEAVSALMTGPHRARP